LTLIKPDPRRVLQEWEKANPGKVKKTKDDAKEDKKKEEAVCN
jgi:hypothetical protein